jgi:zinc protease
VIEERRSRVDNSPSAAFREKLSAARYDVHPYRVPIIGWPEDLETLNRGDAMGFYKSFYGPNNAIVVVVGDVVPEDVLAMAQRHYGVLETREIAERFHPSEPTHTEARRLVHHDPRVRQPSWNRSYRAPSVGTGNKTLIPALEVLSEILGGGSTSRLYRQIVVEDKLAIDVGSYYSDGRLGPGTFALYAVPSSTETEALEEAIETVLNAILMNGVTAEELERAKRSLTASVIYAQDSGRGLANIFGANLVNGQTIADLESWPDRIAAVSYDDILAAAKHVLVAEQSITGILLPPLPEQSDAGDAP